MRTRIKIFLCLGSIYAGFGENTGNIAMMCVMAYYALLNSHQLESFVSTITLP